MSRRGRMWTALGPGGATALIVCGALVIGEAIISHARPVAWDGAYGWQRILAMVLGAVAILVGITRAWQRRSEWFTDRELARIVCRCAPFLIAAVVYFTAFLIMAPVPQGDQPHYELESVGLAYEQTRDMTKNYAIQNRFRIMFPLGIPDVHAYRYKRGGELVQVHNVGLPLLLAPAVPWVREAEDVNSKTQLWPWNLEIILMAALAAQILYDIMRRLRPHRRLLVAGVWGSVVFSAPLVVYSSQVFPEVPAMLLTLVAVDALLKPPRPRATAVGAIACALMPWLHVRFLAVAVLLALGLGVRALAALPAERRGTAAGIRRAALGIGPLVVSLILMGIAFQHWYGSPWPSAPYRLPQTRLPQSLSASWVELTGAFWSSQRGWLPYAPIAILALASVGFAVRRYRVAGLFGLVVASAYLLTITIQGPNPGFSFPGRFELILMPFVALPLLIAAAELRAVRWILWPMAALTLYLTFAIVLEPPPAVAGVPGVTGPIVSQLLWPGFVNIWPAIVASATHFYPDSSAVLEWSLPLLVVSIAGYFVSPPRISHDGGGRPPSLL